MPFTSTIVYCALSMKIPDGHAGVVFGRSSMFLKGILTHVGLIDTDYILPIGVVLFNLTNQKYVVETDQRIAQITFLKCTRMKFNEVKNISTSGIERKGGFGSTGV